MSWGSFNGRILFNSVLLILLYNCFNFSSFQDRFLRISVSLLLEGSFKIKFSASNFKITNYK